MPEGSRLVIRDLLNRIQMEYLEMPGLRLTSWQAQRLWNLDETTCDEIFATLVREQFLSQTVDGAYLRRGTFVTAMYERRWRGLVGGGLSAAAYAISVWAMTKAPVALVASLRETSVLFAALIGTRVLREHLTARRWAGAFAIVLGALALKLA